MVRIRTPKQDKFRGRLQSLADLAYLGVTQVNFSIRLKFPDILQPSL